MQKQIHHQSELGEFEFCGWAYYLHRIEKLRGLANLFLCRGKGVHIARKLNLRQKIESFVDLPIDLLLDAARDEINRHFDNDLIDLHSEQYEGLNKAAAAGRTIDSTLKLVRIDHSRLQPTIQPVQVEQAGEIELPKWPFNIGLRMDALTDKRKIVDCKTSIKRWTQERADKEYQPSVYELGHRGLFAKKSAGFLYHILTITAKRQLVAAYEIKTYRTDAQIIAVLERFMVMHECIRAGTFPPAHQSAWKCSPKWCEFYRHCKFVRT